MNKTAVVRRPIRGAQGSELTYQPALDGLRGVAVMAVLLYHGGVSWMGGGFLGVEVFFVLSGFLITSLLLAEESRGGIRLKDFWARRARRLLPALLALVTVCAAYELAVGPSHAVPDFGADALATLGYVANWHEIWVKSSYFTRSALTSPLAHTWSLAIEEQFYLLWPLVLLGLARAGRRLAARARHLPLIAFCAAGMAGFSLESALLYANGAGLNRVYYGTDTRATGLLAGALLAALVARRPVAGGCEGENLSARLGGRAAGLFGLVGAVGLALFLAAANGNPAFLYRGGFLALDLSVVALLVGATAPGGSSLVKRLLSFAPLRGVGLISYGLYLWHFPLMLWLTDSSTGVSGPALLLLRLGASLGAALVSFFLIEQPIRRRQLPRPALRVLAPLGGAVALALSLLTWGSTPALAGANLVGPRRASQHCTASVGGRRETFHSCPGIRVLMLGDSIGLTLGIETSFHPASYGLIAQNDSLFGCGFVETGLVYFEGGWVSPNPACQSALGTWKADEERFHPEVVMIEMGYWDESNWRRDGRVVHLGQPAYDAELRRAIHHFASVLGGPQLPVVFLSVPIVDPPPLSNGSAPPQASALRRRLVNSIFAGLARKEPRRVHYFDISPYVTPKGRFSTDLYGGICRDSDGVHFYVGQPTAPVQTACGARLEAALVPYLRKLVLEEVAAPRRSG